MIVTDKTVFVGFADLVDLARQFEEKDLGEGTLLYAEYDTGAWEGSAFVLYEHDGKLFEVNASYCSCMGLEGQWCPSETSVAALNARKFFYGTPGAVKFVEQLSAQEDLIDALKEFRDFSEDE